MLNGEIIKEQNVEEEVLKIVKLLCPILYYSVEWAVGLFITPHYILTAAFTLYNETKNMHSMKIYEEINFSELSVQNRYLYENKMRTIVLNVIEVYKLNTNYIKEHTKDMAILRVSYVMRI